MTKKQVGTAKFSL